MSKKRSEPESAIFRNVVLLLLLVLTVAGGVAEASESIRLALTPDELKWIDDRQKPVTVGFTLIPNQVLMDEAGRYHGYAVDLYKKIEKLTGLKLRYVYYPTWQALIDAARNREVDVLFLAQKTSSRLKYLYFTDSVLTLENKIIVPMGKKNKGAVDSVSRGRIAVTRGSAVHEYLKKHYPYARIIPVNNLPEALKLVSSGAVEAAVAEPVRASYYMKLYNLDNLKMADRLGYDYYLGIASRNDEPVLNVILSKAVNAISDEELEALRLKWGYLRQQVMIFDRQTLIYLGIAFGIIIPFSGYLYLTNRRLSRETRAKKRAMNKLRELLKERKRLGDDLKKRVAEEVEKNRKHELLMLQQNRMAQMGELLSMIAHQWRQPLNNLSLLNHMINKKFEENRLDKEAMDHFRKASRRNIELMSGTIDDFRDFYRPEGKRRRFVINTVLEKTLEMVRPAFARDGISLESSLEGPYEICGYANGLAQVIHNILNNARDALKEHDSGAKRITVRLRKKEDRIVLSIGDTAGGVPAEILDRIFDPYFSTKSERNGTGLGLYMSKKIVEEQLDGKLCVHNGEEGAIFILDFAATTEEEK